MSRVQPSTGKFPGKRPGFAHADFMDFAAFCTREDNKSRSIYCCFEIRFAGWALSLLFYDFSTMSQYVARTPTGWPCAMIYARVRRLYEFPRRCKMYARFIYIFCDTPVTTFIRVTSRKHDGDTCFPSFVMTSAEEKSFNCQIRSRILVDFEAGGYLLLLWILTRPVIMRNLSKIAYTNPESITLVTKKSFNNNSRVKLFRK